MSALVWAVAGDRAAELFLEGDRMVAVWTSLEEKAAGEWNPASGCAGMYHQTGEHSGYT